MDPRPSLICSRVGLLVTAHVTMFPVIAAGRLPSSFEDNLDINLNIVGLLLASASSKVILVSYLAWSRFSSLVSLVITLGSLSMAWSIPSSLLPTNFIQYNTKFVKRHVAVASEALAIRTVKKHRRRRTNVL